MPKILTFKFNVTYVRTYRGHLQLQSSLTLVIRNNFIFLLGLQNQMQTKSKKKEKTAKQIHICIPSSPIYASNFFFQGIACTFISNNVTKKSTHEKQSFTRMKQKCLQIIGQSKEQIHCLSILESYSVVYLLWYLRETHIPSRNLISSKLYEFYTFNTPLGVFLKLTSPSQKKIFRRNIILISTSL